MKPERRSGANKILPKKISEAAQILTAKGVGIMPTDTIYGMVGSALSKTTVARIYRLRRRNLKKPMIILIAGMSDLAKFGVKLLPWQKRTLGKLWPGPVSVVLPCQEKNMRYLHRGGNSLAFRLPKPAWLRRLLRSSGPLVAPSANPEGQSPAKNITEARSYFGSAVDFYIKAGKLSSGASTLVCLKDGGLQVLRQGAVKIDPFDPKKRP